MQRLLSAGKIDLIAFEWGLAMLRDDAAPFFRMLESLQATYEVGVPNEEGVFQSVPLAASRPCGSRR